MAATVTNSVVSVMGQRPVTKQQDTVRPASPVGSYPTASKVCLLCRWIGTLLGLMSQMAMFSLGECLQ